MEVNLTFRFLASGYSAVACVTHRPATDRLTGLSQYSHGRYCSGDLWRRENDDNITAAVDSVWSVILMLPSLRNLITPRVANLLEK